MSSDALTQTKLGSDEIIDRLLARADELRLSTHARFALLLLERHRHKLTEKSDPNDPLLGLSWPGVDLLAHKMACRRETARRALADLVESGAATLESERSGAQPTMYRVADVTHDPSPPPYQAPRRWKKKPPSMGPNTGHARAKAMGPKTSGHGASNRAAMGPISAPIDIGDRHSDRPTLSPAGAGDGVGRLDEALPQNSAGVKDGPAQPKAPQVALPGFALAPVVPPAPRAKKTPERVLPFPLEDALGAIAASAGERFVVGDRADWSGRHVREAQAHVKKFADLELWRTIGAWLAAGGLAFRDALDIGWVASPNFCTAMSQAKDWHRRGRPPIPGRNGKVYVAPAPVGDFSKPDPDPCDVELQAMIQGVKGGALAEAVRVHYRPRPGEVSPYRCSASHAKVPGATTPGRVSPQPEQPAASTRAATPTPPTAQRASTVDSSPFGT